MIPKTPNMEPYVSHAQVVAKPMTLGEYNTYRGWKLPENERASQEGYLVEDILNTPQTPMHPDHKGYITWVAKEVFEKNYSMLGASLVPSYAQTLKALYELMHNSNLPHKNAPASAWYWNSLDADHQAMYKRFYTILFNATTTLAVADELTSEHYLSFMEDLKPLPLEKIPASFIEDLKSLLTFQFHRLEGTNLTACYAKLPNNFVIGYGESSCLNPDDFDQVKGESIAKENALKDATDKLWFGEAYARAMHYI